MSRLAGIVIREGLSEDLPEIARILVETWRSTFAGILSERFLATLSIERQLERHARAMASGVRYFVAVPAAGGAPIGFASGGTDRGGDAEATGEVYAIYVARSGQRRGTGRRLLQTLARRLRDDGHRAIVIWVIASNPSIGFYRRLGAVFGTAQPLDLGTERVEQIPMLWNDIERLIDGDDRSGDIEAQ